MSLAAAVLLIFPGGALALAPGAMPAADPAEVARLEACVTSGAADDCLAPRACPAQTPALACALQAAAARDAAGRNLVRVLKASLQPPEWKQLRLAQVNGEEARRAGCELVGMIARDPARGPSDEAACLAARTGERLLELRDLLARLAARPAPR